MKVLVTAFKPFNKNINNYSSEVIKYINNVDKLIIDVLYDRCFEEIEESFNLNDYDLIIALGEARSRDVLTLEIIARNISSCSLPDNSGLLLKDHQIIDGGCDELKTLVNVDKVKDIVSYSYDAGKFVCNNLYYHLLRNYQTKSVFIHIPECHNSYDNYKLYANQIERIIEKLGE